MDYFGLTKDKDWWTISNSHRLITPAPQSHRPPLGGPILHEDRSGRGSHLPCSAPTFLVLGWSRLGLPTLAQKKSIWANSHIFSSLNKFYHWNLRNLNLPKLNVLNLKFMCTILSKLDNLSNWTRNPITQRPASYLITWINHNTHIYVYIKAQPLF